ncbi:hypothetical protein P7K49_022702 [Saguinus oedipus]|uniref:Uncharacterized protein n=1 Tax=Saguinus oedipus TaxID=9490 RepID=A0ABQ9UK54_SAGOE|nr:hypothetical protein P7K49_022702 [Saguinus oedipus]
MALGGRLLDHTVAAGGLQVQGDAPGAENTSGQGQQPQRHPRLSPYWWPPLLTKNSILFTKLAGESKPKCVLVIEVHRNAAAAPKSGISTPKRGTSVELGTPPGLLRCRGLSQNGHKGPGDLDGVAPVEARAPHTPHSRRKGQGSTPPGPEHRSPTWSHQGGEAQAAADPPRTGL